MSYNQTKAEIYAEKAAFDAQKAKEQGKVIGEELKSQGKQAVEEVKKTADLAGDKAAAKAT